MKKQHYQQCFRLCHSREGGNPAPSKYKSESPNQSGFSVLEVILSVAIFAIFSGGAVALAVHSFTVNRLGEEQVIANQYASEGLEAARSIRNQNFTNLVNSTGTGVVISPSNLWAFAGSNNTFGKYTRVLTISDVQRDGSGNIVSSGGTVDNNTKKVTSTVSWNVTPLRSNSIILTTYLTNWTEKRGAIIP